MFSQKTTRRGDPCGRPPPERSYRPPTIAWALPNRGGWSGVFQAPTGTGVLPGAGNGDVERRLSRGTMRPRRAPTRGAPTVIGDWSDRAARNRPSNGRLEVPPPGLRHDPARNRAGIVHQRRPPRYRCRTTRRGDPCGRPPPNGATVRRPLLGHYRTGGVERRLSSRRLGSASGVSMLQWERRHPERRRPRRRLTTSHSKKTGRPHRLSLACVRPHPSPSAKTNGRTDLPPKKRPKTSSRRASSTTNARKRAPRMTPLQTSIDFPLADRDGRRSGVLPGAGWDRRPERRLERRRPRRRLGPASFRAPSYDLGIHEKPVGPHRLFPPVFVRTPPPLHQ